MASSLVVPGQPLHHLSSSVAAASSSSSKNVAFQAGRGSFQRGSSMFSSAVGQASKDGGLVAVSSTSNSSNASVIPETGSIVLGTVQRLTRVQAVLSIVAVDGTALAAGQDWQGIIRRADVRQSNTDSLKLWDCFRPGDVVRASVISLGDTRSYFLSTASNEFGVVFAKHSETGNRLQPASWTEMVDPATGLREPRKVAGPASNSA